VLKLARPFYPLLLAAARKDPELAHQKMLAALQQIYRIKNRPWGQWLLSQFQESFCLDDSRLSQSLWGLNFSNPLGLAAGCDKDGIAAGVWAHFGFGFAELGAATLHPQEGNPRPRLFRLPADSAALNRLGANNLGAAAMAETLKQTWQVQPRAIPIGINLCKSKIAPLEAAAVDYSASFRLLKDWADYFAVNVSSPNTPGLRSLQAGEQLEPILAAIQAENSNNKPILLKISPDLDWDAVTSLLELAANYQIAGIIATNTTIRREGLKTQVLAATGKDIREEAGGISGYPLRQRSTEVIRFIYQQTQGKMPIIGVGGIFTAEDAWEKFAAGASLLQLYTGWIYQGPWVVKQILAGLLAKLDETGCSHISKVIGKDKRDQYLSDEK
jgi:dihydroorotate dehydrogenase